MIDATRWPRDMLETMLGTINEDEIEAELEGLEDQSDEFDNNLDL